MNIRRMLGILLNRKLEFRILVIIFSLSLALLIIGGFVWYVSPSRVADISATDDVAKLDLDRIEIADTAEERAVGLMFREDLCDTCGMLFVFDNEAPRSFWMKDTPTSLDIIFMNSEGEINTIHESTMPLSIEGYASSSPSQYVLEVNAKYARKFDLEVGDRLPVEAFIESGLEFGEG